MKVLALAETKDVKSGWGRYTHEVVSELQVQGIEVDLITSDILLPFSFKNFFKNIFLVRRHITEDISIIHAFDVWPYAVYANLANQFKAKPFFVTGVGTYSIPPKLGIKSMLMKFALLRAKEVFCISRYTLSLIKSRVKNAHTSLVFWGTSKLLPIADAEIEAYKELYTIEKIKFPKILTVGQIKHRKGQLDTLKAIHALKFLYPQILYIIVGSDADTAYVETIRDYAKVNGLVNNLKIVTNQKTDKELSFFYSIADVFAMNSNNEDDHYEGFGLVFLEAAQFGKPAVGSSGCGIEDAIMDGETGYLAKQGDSIDIAEKLGKLLENDDRRVQFGLSAKKRAATITWEKTVQHHINSYKQHAS